MVKKKQTSGIMAFRQGVTPWEGLADTLKYLDWQEYHKLIWRHSSMTTRSPDKTALIDSELGEDIGVKPNKKE